MCELSLMPHKVKCISAFVFLSSRICLDWYYPSHLMEYHPIHVQTSNKVNMQENLLSVVLWSSLSVLSTPLPYSFRHIEPPLPPSTPTSGPSAGWDYLALFGFSFPVPQPGNWLQKVIHVKHKAGLFVFFLSRITVLFWLFSNVWNL